MRIFSAITGIAASLFAPIAYADGLSNACAVLGSTCTTMSSVAVSNFGVRIANLMVSAASGLCVLFIIYGGILMIVSFGDDSRFQKGRNAVMYAMLGFGGAVASQSILAFVASVAVDSTTVNPVVATIVNASNILLDILNVLFILAVIAGGFRMVFARGESDKFDAGRRTLAYAVIGAIIVQIARFLTNWIFTLGL